MVVTLTHHGYIKRTASDNYRAQRRGGRGITALATKEEDFAEDVFATSTHNYLLFFTTKGKVYVKQADGSWHKVETGSFGSYTTFTTTGTEVEVAFVPAKLPVWAFCAGGAALLVLLLLLAKRIKSKRGPKGEKPRREKKGKQPETANAPADELDTPISETDMQ